MAPDLNTVPPSPRPQEPVPMAEPGSIAGDSNSTTSGRTQPANRSPSLSRRVSSQTMGPPPIPHPISAGGSAMNADNTGVGSGPGPLRHPRPLSIADIHLELEKEQEAVVNRLTRELSLLRQQTASVASTASSTSTSLNDGGEHNFPYDSSRHTSRNRSSSTLSSRSVTGGTPHSAGNIAGVTSIAPSRDSVVPPSSRPSPELPRSSFSRDASIASRRPSGTGPPSLSSSFQQHGENFPSANTLSHSHRSSLSHNQHPSTTSPSPSEHRRSGSTTAAQATSRFEEVTHHRAEMEAVRRENELLRRRVRELETTLREYRSPQLSASPAMLASDAPAGQDRSN